MSALRPLSIAEQAAAHLRAALLQGRWTGLLPGAERLAAELGVNHKTMESAIRLLEQEGMLVNQGHGRPRLIVIPDAPAQKKIRLEILPYEESDMTRQLLVEIKLRLQDAGHSVNFSSKSLCELDMDVKKVARYTQGVRADAWLVMAGSEPVLKWFAAQPFPTFALFGRFSEMKLAGMALEKSLALAEAVRRLTELGHRRFVLLVREERRKPEPGPFERKFLELLETEGIRTSGYNLPDWQEDVAGLHRLLDSLFQHTPPTALIIDEGPIFIAARLHLAQRGIIAPRNVSMICLDPDPSFAWCDPAVSHIFWDSGAMAPRILEWADNVTRKKEDHRQNLIKAVYIKGGTIGPVVGKR